MLDRQSHFAVLESDADAVSCSVPKTCRNGKGKAMQSIIADVSLIRAGVSCWVFCFKIDIEHAKIDAPLVAMTYEIAPLEKLLTVIQRGRLDRRALPNGVVQTQLVAS